MATPVSNTVTQSALDFQGLGQLRGQAAQDGNKAIRETAQQFESMFIEMMMKSMRESVEKSDLNESSAEDTFQGMFDKEVAHQMAKRGTVGIADMLVRDHEQRNAMRSTAEALQQMSSSAKTQGIPLNKPDKSWPLNPASATGLPLPAAPAIKPLQGFIPLSAPAAPAERPARKALDAYGQTGGDS
jgi:flagellar protein FlgJ